MNSAIDFASNQQKSPWQTPQIEVLQDQDTEGKPSFIFTEASPGLGPS